MTQVLSPWCEWGFPAASCRAPLLVALEAIPTVLSGYDDFDLEVRNVGDFIVENEDIAVQGACGIVVAYG